MTLDEMAAIWEEDEDSFLQFEKIVRPQHRRPDICAFLMLDELQPGNRDMIGNSEHDEFFLNIDCEKLAAVITREQIIDLHRCGVRYSTEYDCLAMFA